MATAFHVVCQFSILAYALLGGVFLAFSDFIMRSLARTGGAGGIEAMQAVNREVFRYVFMILFIGMAPVSLLLAGYAWFGLTGHAATAVVLAGTVYLVGAFGVTVAVNVPLNEALAPMEPSADETRRFWDGTYLPRWTFWNGVRASACTLASALLLFGLLALAPTKPA